MGTPVIINPIKCFRPILFALNNDPNSEKPMIDFLVKSGLTYLGKQNKNQIGFSRENVFGYGDFRLVISWMRNLATIVSKPDGWDGVFTEVYFDNIRECSTGYVGHYSLAFCYGDYEMMKIAIPNPNND
jgi:hypothetical protein